MSFVSFEFIAFFSLFILTYYKLPHRYRLPLIVVASYIFYAFSRASYVLLIAFSTGVDYFAARAHPNNPRHDFHDYREFGE